MWLEVLMACRGSTMWRLTTPSITAGQRYRRFISMSDFVLLLQSFKKKKSICSCRHMAFWSLCSHWEHCWWLWASLLKGAFASALLIRSQKQLPSRWGSSVWTRTPDVEGRLGSKLSWHVLAQSRCLPRCHLPLLSPQWAYRDPFNTLFTELEWFGSV